MPARRLTVEQIVAELQSRLEPTQRLDVKVNASIGRDSFLKHLAPIECADGFKMSVQASEYHYCTPRNSKGPWTTVEVGYPSKKVMAFMPYIDGPKSAATDTVYGYVPIAIVAAAIRSHKGFAA